jgi:sigma-B regulation protein RsbU (phosphoserine phosphatase)
MQLTDKKKYQLLYDISQQVRDTLDLDEILNHLLDVVKTVFDYDAAGIFVLNRDLQDGWRETPRQMIAGIAQRGFDPRSPIQDDMLVAGKGVIGHVISSGCSTVIPDVSRDPYYVQGRSRTRSEIAVPIIRNERSFGALNLESDHPAAFDESDLEVLQFFADAASISIEKAMLHRQLLEKRLLDEQLSLARQLQLRLFPEQAPEIAGYDMAGICLPTDEIGGDYYDFIPLPGGRVGVAVADVSGHGIPSALVMTAFRGLLRTHTRGSQGLVKIARTINRQLPEFTGESHFVTALYSVLSPSSEEVSFVNCGHHPPLLVHSDGSTDIFKPHGPALGILEHASYPTRKLTMLPGDILLLYTDGVVELRNAADSEFGRERLIKAVHQHRNLPTEQLVEQILSTTRQFSGSQHYPDDFTLVVIKRFG